MHPFRANLRGIFAVVFSQLALVCNDTLVKLASDELPIGEIVFLRGVFASAIAVAAVVATGQYRQLAVLANRLVWLRSAGEVGAMFSYLVALFHSPIAVVTTVFQATPLAVTAAASVFLGERVGWRRWAAILIGFVGVLVVVRPGLEGFDAYTLLVLVTVLCVTFRDIVTRRFPPAIPTLLVTAVTSVVVMAVGGVVGFWESWSTPSALVLGELAAAAVFLNAGYYAIILAMRAGEMSAIAPFRYTAVIFAIIAGFAVWHEVPDLTTLLGMAIIVLTGVYIFHREGRMRRVEEAAAGERQRSGPSTR